MSFDDSDDESFKGAVESLRFNNPPGDPNARQQMGNSTNSMPLQESEGNKDIDNITSSDPITFRRLGVGSDSSLSIQDIRRSGDIQVSIDNPSPPSSPELEFTSVNGIQ